MAKLKNEKLIGWHFFVVAIAIPLLFHLAAGICGWCGLFIGYTFQILSFFAWLVLAFFYFGRLICHWKIGRELILNGFLIFLCIGGGCYCRERPPFSTAFEMRIRHEYRNRREMQNWALGILKTARKADYLIDQSAYPSWAAINHFPPPLIGVINGENMGDDGYVKIAWGSGVAGQWGLEIGKPTLVRQGIKWADGVYFFANPTPAR